MPFSVAVLTNNTDRCSAGHVDRAYGNIIRAIPRGGITAPGYKPACIHRRTSREIDGNVEISDTKKKNNNKKNDDKNTNKQTRSNKKGGGGETKNNK